MTWEKVRECDGKCCEESPRWPAHWPGGQRKGCVFHKPEGGCALMLAEEQIPATCPSLGGMDGRDAFLMTCVRWPHNIENPDEGITGGCCWQWKQDDGD